ncbi:MAG TPA: hypothetical protein VM866_09645 [Pyrinomonadaceae bacterium]|nr:hypothetical protein [Pyrinomonadaceae bacterium]
MAVTCDYCRGACAVGAVKCQSCGAPVSVATSDYRVCPHCERKLLALGSPACNYCGRALPDNYVKAREATLRRVNENNRERAGGDAGDEWAEHESDTVRRLLDNLLGADEKPRRK